MNRSWAWVTSLGSCRGHGVRFGCLGQVVCSLSHVMLSHDGIGLERVWDLPLFL